MWPVFAIIHSYLADFEDSTDVKNTSHKNLYEIVRNPISVYRLIRRRMYFLKDVLNEAHTQGESEMQFASLLAFNARECQ